MLSNTLYVAALCYVALVFFRPTEAFVALRDVRLVFGTSIVAGPLMVAAWWRRRQLPLELPADQLVLAFWLAIGVSNFARGASGAALAGMQQFAPTVFFYFLLRTAVLREGQLRKVLYVIAAAMLFHAIGVIIQHHTGVGWGGVTPYMERTAARGRSVGVFHDPNDLAIGFLLVIPFLAAAALEPGAARSTIAATLAAGAVIMIAFYYANSRGAMVGLAASVLTYAWRRFGPRVGIPIAIAALAILLAFAPSRVSMLFNMREDSAHGRLLAWGAGLDMFAERPLTGVGWGGFVQHHVRPAHNSYLEAFSELGALGGVCFVGLVIAFFAGLGLSATRRSPLSTTNIAIVSIGAGYFIDALFLSKQYHVLTFTVLALGAVCVSVENARDLAITRFGRKGVTAVAIASAAVLVGTWAVVRVLLRDG